MINPRKYAIRGSFIYLNVIFVLNVVPTGCLEADVYHISIVFHAGRFGGSVVFVQSKKKLHKVVNICWIGNGE